MRIVVAAPQPPSPEGGAAGRTTLALLRGLVAHGVEVRAIAPVDDDGPPPAPAPGVELVPVRLPQRGGLRGLAERARRPVSELADTGFAERVHAAAGAADVLHLEQIETACLGPTRVPTVLHLHYRSRLDAPLGPPWRPAFRHRLEFASAERRARRGFEWLMCNSDDVADSLRGGHGAADITVAPLPLDPSDYPIAAPVDAPVVGLIGTATWAPTAAAIRRTLDVVWPQVARARPDARLRIAGRGTDRLRSADPTVELLGTVPSAGGFLAGLAVMLYAAPRGSGTKVKVLEALACGIPVVTTPAGLEGLTPNDGIVLARSDTELVRACRELLRDPAERIERGRAGRRYIEARHAPAPAAAPVVGLYERMLARS